MVCSMAVNAMEKSESAVGRGRSSGIQEGWLQF